MSSRQAVPIPTHGPLPSEINQQSLVEIYRILALHLKKVSKMKFQGLYSEDIVIRQFYCFKLWDYLRVVLDCFRRLEQMGDWVGFYQNKYEKRVITGPLIIAKNTLLLNSQHMSIERLNHIVPELRDEPKPEEIGFFFKYSIISKRKEFYLHLGIPSSNYGMLLEDLNLVPDPNQAITFVSWSPQFLAWLKQIASFQFQEYPPELKDQLPQKKDASILLASEKIIHLLDTKPGKKAEPKISFKPLVSKSVPKWAQQRIKNSIDTGGKQAPFTIISGSRRVDRTGRMPLEHPSDQKPFKASHKRSPNEGEKKPRAFRSLDGSSTRALGKGKEGVLNQGLSESPIKSPKESRQKRPTQRPLLLKPTLKRHDKDMPLQDDSLGTGLLCNTYLAKSKKLAELSPKTKKVREGEQQRIITFQDQVCQDLKRGASPRKPKGFFISKAKQGFIFN